MEATLAGFLENAVCINHPDARGLRHNRIVAGEGFTFLDCSVQTHDAAAASAAKPDIVFEDWNKTDYTGWTVEGTAFGGRPIKKSAMPGYQGDVGGDTERVVNSHASAPGTTMEERDNATGKLTSRPFQIERDFVKFWIGGGGFPGRPP